MSAVFTHGNFLALEFNLRSGPPLELARWPEGQAVDVPQVLNLAELIVEYDIIILLVELDECRLAAESLTHGRALRAARVRILVPPAERSGSGRNRRAANTRQHAADGFGDAA